VISALDALLAPDRLVDLTQPLGPATVLWPGSTPFAATVVADYETDGGYARELVVPEHAGTHLDAPAHFAQGQPATDEIPLGSLVRPLVKLDVRDRVAGDATYELTAAAIEEIEAVDGPIPAGSAVLVHTGWDAYHADADRYGSAFPGLAPDAAALLVARRVAGVGIDTLSVDPAHAEDFPAHRITLPTGLWQLEGLVNLEAVPTRGAWLVAAVIPLADGSGAPARVFAILPPAGA